MNVGLDRFFRTFEEYEPFVNPPYPCLNTTADHYKKMIIWSCQINDNLSKKEELRLPAAVFNCGECGFIYRRLGPDKSSKDKFRYDSVVEYGSLWEQSLAEHWGNLDLSASEIARRFGTTIHLITRHAIRLNLPMNTENTRKVVGYARHQNPRQYFSENQKKYRTEWLKIIEEDRNLNRKELNIKHNFIYLWLKRNDSEWFESRLPPPFIPERKKDHFDWKKIDKELAEKVTDVCLEILKESELVRICITEIIKRIGYKKWLEKRDKKLPLTSRILNNSLESLEDFMLRKLKVAEQIYIQEKKVPTRNQLIYRSVIVNSTSKNSPKIQKEINETLDRIKKKGSIHFLFSFNQIILVYDFIVRYTNLLSGIRINCPNINPVVR